MLNKMLKKPFLLYKIHENEDCKTLQNIVRFLYIHNIDFRPLTIIERNFPPNINVYPTLVDNNDVLFVGIDEIVDYIESKIGKNDIINKSNLFNEKNPEYRITDHKMHVSKLNMVEL